MFSNRCFKLIRCINQRNQAKKKANAIKKMKCFYSMCTHLKYKTLSRLKNKKEIESFFEYRREEEKNFVKMRPL